MIFLPTSAGAKIVKQVLKKTGFNFKLFGMYYVSCDVTKFQNISLLINDYWFEVPASTYIMNLGSFGGSFCNLGFALMYNQEMFILGDVFLRNYYSVWDTENNRIGFARMTNGPQVSQITAGTTPAKLLS